MMTLNEFVKVKLMCQCPKSGSIHFYVLSANTALKRLVCVNALSRAQSISTGTGWERDERSRPCVNALSRAQSISTVTR